MVKCLITLTIIDVISICVFALSEITDPDVWLYVTKITVFHKKTRQQVVFFRLDKNGRCEGNPTKTQVIVLVSLNVFALFIVNTIAILSFILPLRQSVKKVYPDGIDKSTTSEPVSDKSSKFSMNSKTLLL